MSADFQTVRSADGTLIAYERVGSGPPLLLVGGAFNERSSAAPLATALASRFCVFTVDRRGRGDSDNTLPYAVAREVEDLAAVVAAIEHADVGLYGHSSGGCLVLEAVAAGVPATRIALYETPYGTTDADAQDGAAMAHDIQAHCDAGRFGDAAARFLAGTGMPAGAIAGMRASPDWAWFERLAPTLVHDMAVTGNASTGARVPADRLHTIAVPALVIDGGASPPFLQDGTRVVATTLRQARQMTLAGQTHQVDPTVLAPVLTEFFGG